MSLLIEGTCEDVRVGPVLDVAVGARPDWTHRQGAWFTTGLRAMFNQSLRRTAIRSDLIVNLRLKEDPNGLVRVSLLFREPEGRGMALIPDVVARKINTFNNARHEQMLDHAPEEGVGVLVGGDVLSLADYVLLDNADGWRGSFIFSVDTGEGITPARLVRD